MEPVRIAVIDYEMGNLRSVQKALESLGQTALVTRSKKEIAGADGVILPGVGAFRDCMKNLETFGLVDPILKYIDSGKPFLGICLGLQLLFTESEEFGLQKGLDVIPGRVVRFPDGMEDPESPGTRLKVPHMGWNRVTWSNKGRVPGGPEPGTDHPLFIGLADGSHFYFVHSYYAIPEDPGVTAASTRYGIDFCSAVRKGNVHAVQFHPEKSQAHGLTLLNNFITLCRNPSPVGDVPAAARP
jgi:glutamine amidotransferase